MFYRINLFNLLPQNSNDNSCIFFYYIPELPNVGLKLRKKLETTGFDTVTQAQNHLKSINKKLKLWDERIFINQGKKF